MKIYCIIILAVFILSNCSCKQDVLLNEKDDKSEESVDLADYADWTEATHGNSTEQNYTVVFNQKEVLRFDIKISSENWQKMQTDLASNVGSGQGIPGQPPGDTEYDLLWVPCDVYFNNIKWYKVGIRYKGNSSLRSSYQRGLKKLPLKLDFDQFEDTYPVIHNQRFYGFKQLSLKNNFEDKSFMREKVASDVFSKFGLVSPKTAFYRVYIDFGEGEIYFGLYTIVEEVDDSVIETMYDGSNGNLYKPEGAGASFAAGFFNVSDMYKKINKTENDYSDVQQLYTIINSSERETSNDQWKEELNAIFNVPLFLKWLAANIAMQNWDTYGKMTHNYYLYNNPELGKLEWIPWDNNEALQDGKMGGALSLSLSEVGNNWPLIRYIIDIDEYKQIYESYLLQFIDEVFIPSNMISIYSRYFNLLQEYAYAEESGYTFLRNDSEFDQAVETLKTHVQSRNDAVIGYLNEF